MKRGRLARSVTGAAAFLALTAAVVAGVLWWWFGPRPDPALDLEWTAYVQTIAGDGLPGRDDGEAFRARFLDVFGVAVSADGSVYVSDAGESPRIRRIERHGVVSTVAGGARGHADGPTTFARFDSPSALAFGPDGALYVADTANNMIRRVGPDGVVTTVAGSGAAGYQDGIGFGARFNGPVGLAVDAAGRVVVADTYNDRVRAVDPRGVVTTIAGSGLPGWMDGAAAAAQFDTPSGVALDAAGNIYVADTGNDSVRMISPDGLVSTVWPLPPGGLRAPVGIAVTGAGVVYVTDIRGRVIEITPRRRARVLAGSAAGFADGAAAAARLRAPAGMALIEPGRLVVADPRNAVVREVASARHRQLPPPPPLRRAAAFGSPLSFWTPLLWPFVPMDGPFEITGTLGEPRGGDQAPRFHAGLDIYAPEGTIVRAVREGAVVAPLATSAFGTLNESVRVGPLTYVHLRVGRDHRDNVLDPAKFVASYDAAGRIIRIRVKRGARFRTGEMVGSVNRFYHAHLNVGSPGEQYNPLGVGIAQLEDTVPPRILRGGIRLYAEHGTRLTGRRRGRLVASGRVRIVVDAWDQVNGNLPRRRLGLYALGYQVLTRDGSPVAGFEQPRVTIRFDRLADSEQDAPRIVYAEGSGIPFYSGGVTRFLYNVTSTFAGGVAAPGALDTTTLPDGDYIIRILAADIHGNQAIANRDLLITVDQSPPDSGS